MNLPLSAPKRSQVLVLALICLLFAEAFRVVGFARLGPQPDEPLWVNRSAKVLYMLEHRPLRATTHLPHPGLTASVLMAGSQWLRSQFYDRYQITSEHPLYLTKLEVSRLVIAAASALLAPIMFLLLLPVVGTALAFLAAMLAALDPRLIGFSQMAHLDTILTLLVTTCVLLYVHAVRRESLRLKLLAGGVWGLCILTKPTSALVVPILILYNALRRFVQKRSGSDKRTPIISWSDVGAIAIGHLLFVMLYTRTWVHRSDYRGRMGIRTRVAGNLWEFGTYFQQNLLLFLGIVGVLTFITWHLYRSHRTTQRSWKYHAGILLASVTTFLILLALIPQVFENIARYWKWTSSLSGASHESFGKVKAPTELGYLDLFLTEIPLIGLLGVAMAIPLVSVRAWRERSERDLFILFCMIAACLWISVVNVSSKQAWRYAYPAVPFIYMVAAYGLLGILDQIMRALPKMTTARRRLNRSYITGLFVALLCGLQTLDTARAFPNYLVYFNGLRQGLKGAVARGQSFPLVGQRELVQYLMNEVNSREDIDSLYVTVFGSAKTLRDTSIYMYGKEAEQKLRFAFFPKEVADYVATYQALDHMIPSKGWDDAFEKQPAYSFKLDEISLFRLHRVPVEPFEEPYVIKAGSAHSHTGKLVYNDQKKRKLTVVTPEKDERGYLIFTDGVRVPASEFTLNLEAGLLPSPEGASLPSADQRVLRLDLGNCSKEILAGELSTNGLSDIELRCSFEHDIRVFPRSFWYGQASLHVGDLKLKRVG